jgi:molybdate transport system substrate-binding protein
MKVFQRLRRRAIGMAAVIVATMALIAASATPLRADNQDGVLVFAAASLTDALASVEKSYEADTGHKIVLSFAGSSTLARQIAAGSPAQMFLSADEDWMDYLAKADVLKSDTRSDLLGNRLVLVAPESSKATLTIAKDFPLAAALDGGRLAVADPTSVPAGKYARAALTSLGVWSSVEGHLAVAQNVRVALAFVARGETPFGIVYETDAMTQPDVRIVDAFPAGTHASITYPVALTKSATPAAAAFLAYLKSDAATVIFKKAGFTPLAKGH